MELDVPKNLEPGDEQYEKFIQQFKLHIGLSDVKDCFHRLKQPAWLSEYFALGPVPASWVGLQGPPTTRRSPWARRAYLPMPGFLLRGIHLVPLLQPTHQRELDKKRCQV